MLIQDIRRMPKANHRAKPRISGQSIVIIAG